MPLLTKEQIVSAEDGAYETMHVPEWKGEIYVRSLRGTQRGDLAKNGDNVSSWDAYVCQMGIVDDKGNPLFTYPELDKLASKHPAVLERIAHKILVLSGLNKEAKDAIDANFPITPTNGGGTGSPEKSEPNTTASTMEST